MKIMVSGATGFIGKELIKKLNEKGHEISVLTRNPETARFHIPAHCNIHLWNPEKYGLAPSVLKDVDAIINLAGEGIADRHWSPERKRKILKSRVLSTRRLVEAMTYMDKKPDVFVSASAIGFYGNRGEEFLSETQYKGRGFLSDVCQKWEDEIFKAKNIGVRTVACRIGMVLGHDGGALNKMLPPFKLGVGGKLGNGSHWMSWIHVHDLVNMLIHAVENSSMDGVYNAVAPHPVRNKEFTSTLGKILKRPTLFTIPGFGLKVGLGELSNLLLDSQRVLAKKVMNTGFEFQYPHLEEALQEICDHTYHEINMVQWVPQPVNRTFSFFKEARNLEKITPKFLNFKVLDQSTPEICEGTKINYSLSLHGLPMGWQSKITDWKPGRRFSDIQVKGPYNHWHHSHEFEEKNGGTLIKDRVLYRVPFGLPGDLIAGWLIKKDLEQIFNYRYKVIDTLMAH